MDNDVMLLVEDNPDDEALTLRAFKKNGIKTTVVVARDGVEALDYLLATGAHAGRDIRQRPRVVLLDLKLPKIDGLEVLKRLRMDERTKSLPIVVLSSSKEEQDMRQAYALGANSYLCKPVDFTEFVEGVRQIWQYWLVLNQLPLSGKEA